MLALTVFWHSPYKLGEPASRTWTGLEILTDFGTLLSNLRSCHSYKIGRG